MWSTSSAWESEWFSLFASPATLLTESQTGNSIVEAFFVARAFKNADIGLDSSKAEKTAAAQKGYDLLPREFMARQRLLQSQLVYSNGSGKATPTWESFPSGAFAITTATHDVRVANVPVGDKVKESVVLSIHAPFHYRSARANETAPLTQHSTPLVQLYKGTIFASLHLYIEDEDDDEQRNTISTEGNTDRANRWTWIVEGFGEDFEVVSATAEEVATLESCVGQPFRRVNYAFNEIVVYNERIKPSSPMALVRDRTVPHLAPLYEVSCLGMLNCAGT